MTDIGLSLSARAALPPAEYARAARRAEQAGFTAVFATETASDSLPLAQAMLHETTSISVGTAIANIYWRHPALMAVGAGTLSQLSGNRFLLGLGTANAALNHHQLGMPATPPLATMREYVEVVRAVSAGDPATYQGSVYQVNGFTAALGAAPDLPVYVAALLPRMLELAGEVADGVILNFVGPATAAQSVARVRQAAQRAGRDPASVRVLCVLPCALSDDATASAAAARSVVAGYARHPAAVQLFAASPLGSTDLAEVARVAGSDGLGAAADLVDDVLANDLVVSGQVADRVRQYREAGVDLPVLFPVPVRGDWSASIDAALAATASL